MSTWLSASKKWGSAGNELLDGRPFIRGWRSANIGIELLKSFAL